MLKVVSGRPAPAFRGAASLSFILCVFTGAGYCAQLFYPERINMPSGLDGWTGASFQRRAGKLASSGRVCLFCIHRSYYSTVSAHPTGGFALFALLRPVFPAPLLPGSAPARFSTPAPLGRYTARRASPSCVIFLLCRFFPGSTPRCVFPLGVILRPTAEGSFFPFPSFTPGLRPVPSRSPGVQGFAPVVSRGWGESRGVGAEPSAPCGRNSEVKPGNRKEHPSRVRRCGLPGR